MENVTVDISSVLYPMNNKAKARYMINLLDKGYVLKHILTNTAPEHNDKQYEESYSSFLNAEIIDIIKQVKGDHTYE
jgi:hypothetical protein